MIVVKLGTRAAGSLDLETAQYCLCSALAARKQGRALIIAGAPTPEQQQDLRWLGVDWSASDGSSQPAAEAPALPAFHAGEGLPVISRLRAEGYLPEAVANYLIALVWDHPGGKDLYSLPEAAELFESSQLRKSQLRFDSAALELISARWMIKLDPGKLAEYSRPFLREYECSLAERGHRYWETALDELRSCMRTLRDAYHLGELLCSLSLPGMPEECAGIEDAARERAMVVAKAWREVLDDVPLEEDRDCYTPQQFKRMTVLLRKRVELETPEVLQSLRLSILGSRSGPDLPAVVPLVPRHLLKERVSELLANL